MPHFGSKSSEYIWIGNGVGPGRALLHNPHYDFNDGILPVRASYWVRLAESVLSEWRRRSAPEPTRVPALLQAVADQVAGDHC